MRNPVLCISSMATRGFLREAIALGEPSRGAEVRIESVAGVEARRRVQADESFDLVVLEHEAIVQLAAAGLLVRETITELVRSSVAIAVPRGAARPPLHDGAALLAALLAAPSIAYSGGPSGRALQQLLAQWGIAEQLAPRMVQAPPGVPVAQLLVDGSAALGFQQRSELIDAGVDIVGAMPPGLEIVTTFSGALARAAGQPDVAGALLAFLGSPVLDATRDRHGLHPPAPTAALARQRTS